MASSDPTPSTLENGLPTINRYITTTTKSGEAVFSTAIPSLGLWDAFNATTKFFLGYTTRAFPIKLLRSQSSSDAPPDIATYQADIATPPGISISDGTAMRYVDMAPGSLSPMHYTKSIDYGIVLEGEVECILDSGEKRLMKRGDSCVQRGTYHAWRNVSGEGVWARMVFVLVGAEGEGLEEELAVKEMDEKSE